MSEETNNTPTPEHVFCDNPYWLRALDAEWVNGQAAALAKEGGLAEPDLAGAFSFVAELMIKRVAWNYDEAREVLIYPPSGDNDPYILAVPLKKERRKQTNLTAPPNHFPSSAKTSGEVTLREEFENLVFEREEGFVESDLRRGEDGKYTNPNVQTLFEGFSMYQKGVEARNAPHYRDVYGRVMGRYVLARVNNMGHALFVGEPYRHRTRAGAVEEGIRLAQSTSKTFGLFRCVDIIAAKR